MNDENSYEIYKGARMLVMTAFGLISITNAIVWVSFSPINSLVADLYGKTSTDVNFLSLVFLIVYTPSCLLSIYATNRYGLKTVIIIASMMNFVGCLIRYLSTFLIDSNSNLSFSLLLVGQTIPAIGQPFLLNLPTVIAATWYELRARAFATVIASIMNPVGIAIGTVLPILFVYRDTNGAVLGLDLLLLCQLILSFVTLILAFVIKSKPPTAPSKSEQDKLANPSADNALKALQSSYKDAILCLKNKEFLKLLFGFGIGLGIFNALTTLIEQLVKPFCYTPDDATLFVALLLGAGLINSAIVGFLLDKYHRYAFSLKIGFSSTTMFMILFCLSLRPNALGFVAISSFFLGASVLPMLPVTLEAAVEILFPIAEDVPSALLLSMGQISGMIFIIVMGDLLAAQPICPNNFEFVFTNTSIILIATVGVCTLCILFFKEDNKRFEHDRANASATEVLPLP